jgi:hypothetical protein
MKQKILLLKILSLMLRAMKSLWNSHITITTMVSAVVITTMKRAIAVAITIIMKANAAVVMIVNANAKIKQNKKWVASKATQILFIEMFVFPIAH